MQRCLIIDTSAIVRKVTRIILSDFGFESVEAADGAEALAELNNHVPDLALVAAHLTDIPSLDLLRQIRVKSGGKTYVIYCTTNYDIIELQMAHAAGAHDLLVKPFDRVSLAQKLDARTLAIAKAAPANFYAKLIQAGIKRIA